MSSKDNSIEQLLESIEYYAKTNVELYKLKILKSTSISLGWILINIAIIFLLMMVFFMFNIAIAIWFGTICGNLALGFASVALFYLLIFVFVFFFFYKGIKTRLTNLIISKLTE